MTARVGTIWLRAASVVTILTGVICALASHPSTGGLWLYLFDVVKWPIDGDPAVFNADTRAVNAMLGGVMVGWGPVSRDVHSAAGVVEQTVQRLTRKRCKRD